MITIRLTQQEYDQLLVELYSLSGYHWNDQRIHADDCGSKVLDTIISTVQIEEEEHLFD